jgi:hypothetical protein
MKSLYLALILFFCSFSMLDAQDLEYVWDGSTHGKTDVIKYNLADSTWIVARSEEKFYSSSVHITKLDKSGNEIWDKEIEYNGLVKVFDLDINDEGRIFFITNYREACSYIERGVTLHQYNSDGNFISKKDFFQSFTFNDMIPLGSNQIVIASSNSVHLYDTIGNVLPIQKHDFTSTSSKTNLQLTPNGELIVIRDDKIWKLDAMTLNTLNSISVNKSYEAILQDADCFLLIDDNGDVTKMDATLNSTLTSFNVSSFFDKVEKFQILSNNSYVILGKKNTTTQIKILDTSFVEVHNRQFLSKQAFINTFEIGNQEIALGGSTFFERHHYNNHVFDDYNGDPIQSFSNSFIKTIDFNLQSNDVTTDLEILNIIYNLNVNSFSCYYAPTAEPNIYDISNVLMTVKNNGTETINNLNIYYYSPYGCFLQGSCIEDAYSNSKLVEISGLNVPPNVTTTIPISDMNYEAGPNSFSPTIYLSSVNNKLQNKISDSYYTLYLVDPVDPIDPVDPVDPNDTTVYDNYLNIYPNPAFDFITIQVAEDIESMDYQIYNMIGEAVQVENDVSIMSKKNIDISNLQTGSYIFKFQTDIGLEFIRRFIKL